MTYQQPGLGRILAPLLVREGAVDLVRRGLPFTMLDNVAAAAGVGRLALAEIIGLSRTTFLPPQGCRRAAVRGIGSACASGQDWWPWPTN